MNPLITTLATWWIVFGIAMGLTKGTSPGQFPESFEAIGRTRILGLLPAVWYALAVTVVGAVVFSFTVPVVTSGRPGETATLLASTGFEPNASGCGCICCRRSALPSSGSCSRPAWGAPPASAFDGLTLEVIAAAVIGGAALTGGRGSIVGGLLGLFLLKTLASASVSAGISPFWQRAITGVVLLAAVGSDSFSRWRNRRLANKWRASAT